MKKPPKPKKAYTVYTQSEDGWSTNADIAFCHSVNELKRNEEYTGFERSPEYDDWAEIGYVPAGFLDLQGWWFNCWECEGRVDWDDDDDGNPQHPVFCGTKAFCSAECCKAYDDKREKVRSMRAIARQQFDTLFPEATIISSWVQTEKNRVQFDFKFPGGKGWAHWSTDEPGAVSHERRDAGAWEAYRKAVNSTLFLRTR